MLIIDDIEPALALLPPAMRAAVDPSVQRLRTRIHDHASAQSHTLLSHAHFTDWILNAVDPEAVILSLDRLIGPSRDGRIHPISAHRFWSGGRLETRVDITGISAPSGAQLVLIDDAVYTGSTLRDVINALAAESLSVSCVYVGAAKQAALASVGCGRLKPFTLVEDGDILHMRDYCPLLPFSGRSVTGRGQAYRSAALFDRNGVTQHLDHDETLRQLLIKDCGAILSAIDDWCGQAVTPDMLREICPSIAIPLPGRAPDSDPQRVFDMLRDQS